MNVFALDGYTAFAVLQSRAHYAWARLLSSSMREDLRYSVADCFETFPFPHPDPRTPIPALEDVGERLYRLRAEIMVRRNEGLTQTYNRLKDPKCGDADIAELRALHEEMDRAVLAAYGWNEVAVPPYTTPTDDAERKALEAFEDDVIDRLFVLNAERAESERRKGGVAKPKKGGGLRKGRSVPNDETPQLPFGEKE